MFTSYLSQQDMNKQVIFLQGIYLKNPKHDARWSCRYDILRDENTQTEITLQIPYKLCEDLKDGNLVTVGGVLGRRVQNNSHIQLMLVVSRVEIVQEQAIDENEIKALKLYPIEDVWGIGRRYAAKLQALGVRTAYDFAQHHGDWVRLTFNNINIYRTWQEQWKLPLVAKAYLNPKNRKRTGR